MDYTFLFQPTKNELDQINNLKIQLSKDFEPLSLHTLQILCQTSPILVAKNEGIIVGMLTLARSYTLDGSIASLEDIVVEEHCRRQGIGTELLLRIIDHTKKHNIKKITLTSRPEREEANNLYKKLGFQLRNTNMYVRTIS